jgi:hypothetical protein
MKNVWTPSSAKLTTSSGAHVDNREDHRAQQRQTNDFQRHHDKDRERDIEEERVRLRIDGMRLNRAIATFSRNIPLHKLKLPTFSGVPAKVYDQITSSMESQLLGSFTGKLSAAYAKARATGWYNSHNTQHTRIKKIHLPLCKRAISPARHVLEGKLQKTLAYGKYKQD